jgi:hypothetical protein
VRPKSNKVLEIAVSDGVERGWHRAHKHNDTPTPENICDHICQAVLEEIDEWFDMQENGMHD